MSGMPPIFHVIATRAVPHEGREIHAQIEVHEHIRLHFALTPDQTLDFKQQLEAAFLEYQKQEEHTS